MADVRRLLSLPALPNDQIGRMRAGFLGLLLLFCGAESAGSLATPHAPVVRVGAVALLATLAAAHVAGYRRGSFPWRLRTLIVVTVLALAPLLEQAIVGAAFCGTYLLSLYRGPTVWTTIALAAAVLVGAISGGALEPGSMVGEIGSLFVLARILNQLLSSVAARDALQEALTRQAHYDALTGLANRRLFGKLLDASRERHRRDGEPYAVLMLDVDDFKRINDTYGHQCGDAVLAEVGRRAAACVRSSDRCARVGGDEFAVLVERCGERRIADELAARLVEEIKRPLEAGGAVHHVSVSAGVAFAGDADAIGLREADRAMYAVKWRTTPRTAVPATG